MQNPINFISGMQQKFVDLQTQLDSALATFEDTPTVTLSSGSCPFQASWYGDTFTVDPLYVYFSLPSYFIRIFYVLFVFWGS